MKKYTGYEIYLRIKDLLNQITNWEESRGWAKINFGESSKIYKQCQEKIDRLRKEFEELSEAVFVKEKDLDNQ